MKNDHLTKIIQLLQRGIHSYALMGQTGLVDYTDQVVCDVYYSKAVFLSQLFKDQLSHRSGKKQSRAGKFNQYQQIKRNL